MIEKLLRKKILLLPKWSFMGRKNLRDGKSEGLDRLYHLSGKIFTRGYFKDEVKEGLFESYYKNTQLPFKSTHKDNLLIEGDRYSYHDKEDIERNGVVKRINCSCNCDEIKVRQYYRFRKEK